MRLGQLSAVSSEEEVKFEEGDQAPSDSSGDASGDDVPAVS